MPKRPRKPAPVPRDLRAVRLLALALFAAGLLVRILFWRATADRAWAWSAYFKGDAPLWIDWARAIAAGKSFELGLPIHPPGAAYLAAFLWNELPSGIPFLRLAWIVLGSLVPVFVFLAAERSFGLLVAAAAGCFAALSTALLVLSASINNETPYLVLAIGSFWFTDGLREKPGLGRLLLWSVLNGVACLFRVEHLLFYLLALAFFAIGWMRRSGFRAVSWAAASLFFFALPLVPWHAKSWNAIARLNRDAPSPRSGYSARVAWDAGALRRRDELPGFARGTASEFVAATVAYRGRQRVRAADYSILDEAFGYVPRPFARHPFVSSYGPLNFALANAPGATGAFDRTPLEQPPPLGGGASRYPPELVSGLPPAELSFVYPPHLRLYNEGYAVGARGITAHPADFVRLAVQKLAVFGTGAALGVTGWNLPLGLSGLRRPVDLVVPDGGVVALVWRIFLFAACLAGILAARKDPASIPWLLFLASKLVVTVAFFGYARQGAAVVPVMALLVALTVKRWILRGKEPRPRVVLRGAVLLLALGVALETVRFAEKPGISIDGQPAGASDPLPPGENRPHAIRVRVRAGSSAK
jgi:hypothetical protein